jgi:hypothetical protein
MLEGLAKSTCLATRRAVNIAIDREGMSQALLSQLLQDHQQHPARRLETPTVNRPIHIRVD